MWPVFCPGQKNELGPVQTMSSGPAHYLLVRAVRGLSVGASGGRCVMRFGGRRRQILVVVVVVCVMVSTYRRDGSLGIRH